jgi:putative membrane protein
MVSYNPKEWIRNIFRFHKADTVQKLKPYILAVGAYSWLVAFWNLNFGNFFQQLSEEHTGNAHPAWLAISMLLVFRTNTAYDRWWEGRKLWGSLVNNSRNLAIKLSAILPEEELVLRNFFRKIISAYAFALHKHLRKEETRLALFEDDQHEPVFKSIDHKKHVPNQVALIMMQRIHKMHRENNISGEQLIFLNNELQSFTDICGACERIKNTPIPFSYSMFIKKFIFIYVATLPFGYVFTLGYYVIPVVAFVFYVLASLELIAEEIEDPFSGDENDIPTEMLAKNIELHLSEII